MGTLNSANLTDTNEAGSKVSITNSSIADFNPASTINLPAHSMTVYTWSSAGGTRKPTPVATTTSLSATPASVAKGKILSLIAKVVPKSGGTVPSGNIVFKDGSGTVGTTALNDGSVSLNVSTLSVGTHTISADFIGSTSYGASVSSAIAVTITAPLISTTTTLTAPTQVTDGKAVALSVVVGKKSGATPTGTATFYAGSTKLGSAALSGGKAKFTIADLNLKAATYPVSVTYSGSSVDASSKSNTVQIKVAKATTITTKTALALSSAKVKKGQKVTARITVKAASGAVPAGSVKMYLGSSLIATLKLSKGIATYSTTASADGTYQTYAVYEGSAADTASTSAKETINVGS